MVSTYIYDYLKSNSRGPQIDTTIKHHNEEMARTGYPRAAPMTYTIASNLLFYGIGHEAGYNGCMVVLAPEGLSCLSGPSIVGLTHAAEDIYTYELVKKRQHIGLTLLPMEHHGGEPEFGGFENNFVCDYLSDGFRVTISYERQTFDPRYDIGHGLVTVRVVRVCHTTMHYTNPFFEKTYRV